MPEQPTSALAGFTGIYAGDPPWETGRPQPPFIAMADRVVGPLLDCGCGTGTTALFFAARGLEVTGIDFVEEALRLARAKADQQGLSVEFLRKDAMTLADWERRFASVIDSGLFHIYAGDERRRYVAGLANVLKPGGRLFLFVFSDEEPGAPGGGVSMDDLNQAFSRCWEIESVETVRGELNPAFTAVQPDAFSKGGPLGRFAIIRRRSPVEILRSSGARVGVLST
jgi:SAM-dependent methyltransferase